jgi:hypothetical protein
MKKNNTTLSEQFQNLEKQKIPHCRNRSKFWKNKKCHTVGTVSKSGKTKNATVGTVPKSGKTKNPTPSFRPSVRPSFLPS